MSNDPAVIGGIASIIAYHRWSGSLYSDCYCGVWQAGRKNTIVSHPGHVADEILTYLSAQEVSS